MYLKPGDIGFILSNGERCIKTLGAKEMPFIVPELKKTTVHGFFPGKLVIIKQVDRSYSCVGLSTDVKGLHQIVDHDQIIGFDEVLTNPALENLMKFYTKSDGEKQRDKIETYFNTFLIGFHKLFGHISGYNDRIILRCAYDAVFGVPYNFNPIAKLAAQKNISFKKALTTKELIMVCHKMSFFVKNPESLVDALETGQKARLSSNSALLQPLDQNLISEMITEIQKIIHKRSIKK